MINLKSHLIWLLPKKFKVSSKTNSIRSQEALPTFLQLFIIIARCNCTKRYELIISLLYQWFVHIHFSWKYIFKLSKGTPVHSCSCQMVEIMTAWHNECLIESEKDRKSREGKKLINKSLARRAIATNHQCRCPPPKQKRKKKNSDLTAEAIYLLLPLVCEQVSAWVCNLSTEAG